MSRFSENSPVSPLERCETILTMPREHSPRVIQIKLDRHTYACFVFVGTASAFMNSSAVGLGIYNLLTSSVSAGGFGIVISPVTGGILAFVTTAVLFANISYRICDADIKSLKSLIENVQRSHLDQEEEESHLKNQQIRFIKNSLMLYQNIVSGESTQDKDQLEKKIKAFFQDNHIHCRADNFMEEIKKLYDKIVAKQASQHPLLTKAHFEEYLTENPEVLLDFFPNEALTQREEKTPSCRQSACARLSLYFFAPLNTVINLLGAVSLTVGQSAQAGVPVSSPAKLISTTSIASVLGGGLIYLCNLRNQDRLNQLEAENQNNLRLIQAHKAKTSAFSKLGSYVKGYVSESNQDVMTRRVEEYERKMDALTLQLAEKEAENQRLREQLHRARSAEKEYKRVRTRRPEAIGAVSLQEEVSSPSGREISSPRSPMRLMGTCTVRKPTEVESQSSGCVVS